MKKRVDIYIKGKIDSKGLYKRLSHYEPLIDEVNVTDITTETYVSASCDLSPNDIEKIISICKEYGECDIEVQDLPIIIN